MMYHCDHCNTERNNNEWEDFPSVDGRTICEECVECHFFHCTHCKMVYEIPVSRITGNPIEERVDGGLVCNECCKELYVYHG